MAGILVQQTPWYAPPPPCSSSPSPTARQIARFLAAQRSRTFSYREVGASRRVAPPGYQVDHNRVQLGEGRAAFARAVDALRTWKPFDLGWISAHPDTAPLEPGITVAVRARHFGFWSLNACRIVYTLDEEGPVVRFGFAYGTLPDHAEQGEERFSVEWHHEDNSVWYDLFAFSRPNHPLARLGAAHRPAVAAALRPRLQAGYGPRRRRAMAQPT